MLIACVLICLVGSLIFEFVYGSEFVVYAAYYSSAQDNPAELSFLQILSTIIVLNTFVPISLYVTWVHLSVVYCGSREPIATEHVQCYSELIYVVIYVRTQ